MAGSRAQRRAGVATPTCSKARTTCSRRPRRTDVGGVPAAPRVRDLARRARRLGRRAAHDEAVAVISHVPHVAAAALINLAAARGADAGEDVLRLAAGGFKDMTRIAAGSPELWTGICLDNRTRSRAASTSYIDELAAFVELPRRGRPPRACAAGSPRPPRCASELPGAVGAGRHGAHRAAPSR